MKLFEVLNGFMGNGAVSVLIIASSKAQALELAEIKYKTEVMKKGLNLGYRAEYHVPSYFNNLHANELCEDTSKPFVGDVSD